MATLLPLCLLALLTLESSALSTRPNILVLVTDDQDQLSGSMEYMPKVRSLITELGTTFKGFVPDATCCPSRAAILSGRYPRNTGILSNDLGCGGTVWQDQIEPTTVAVSLHDSGYHTGLIGKYLNQYGMRNPGLLAWVPPGWDYWYAQGGPGSFYSYNISNMGVLERHGTDYAADYSTDLFARKACEFFDLHVAARPNDPFFLYTALIAPHQPEVAPQYVDSLPGIQPTLYADIYNLPDQQRHWLIRNAGVYGPYGQNGKDLANYQFRRRVLSLLSADDAVEVIINKIAAIGELDNTYIFFISDNGFHFLDYGHLQGNFMPYERDVRVPFLLRGPGIPVGFTLEQPFALSIDIAPTILDIANIAIPNYMDGQTLLPFLDPENIAVGPHPGGDFLIEHTGQVAPVRQTVPCALAQLTCGRIGGATSAPLFTGTPECMCNDGANNTYTCLRILDPNRDLKYCEFADSDNYRELYDLSVDPNEAHNIYQTTLASNPTSVATYSARTALLKSCTGPACRTRSYPPLPCTSSPCQNGGVCANGPNYSYQCSCPIGYAGVNCETDVDECTAHPCVHGSCSTPSIASYQCTCEAGWTGVNCDVDFDECSLSPCAHGTCSTPSFNSFECHCNVGWEGTLCTHDINGCAGHTNCRIGGDTLAVCVDLSAPQIGYSCLCSSHYHLAYGTCVADHDKDKDKDKDDHQEIGGDKGNSHGKSKGHF